MATDEEILSERRQFQREKREREKRGPRTVNYNDPKHEEAERMRQAKFQEAIAQSSRSTRQGRLLDAILSDPHRDVLWSLCLEYWGYTRGLKSFIKIIEAENIRLWQTAKPDEVDSPFFFGHDYTLTEAIFYTIGAMNSRESHQTLLDFMDETYHPLIRSNAVQGMSQERTMFDHRLVLDILNGDLPIVIRWEAIYSAECNLHKFTKKEYLLAIEQYLYHEDHNVRSLAIRALCHAWAGRKILRRYLEALLTGQIKTSWSNEVSTIEQCLEFYRNEDARRKAK